MRSFGRLGIGGPAELAKAERVARHSPTGAGANFMGRRSTEASPPPPAMMAKQHTQQTMSWRRSINSPFEPNPQDSWCRDKRDHVPTLQGYPSGLLTGLQPDQLWSSISPCPGTRQEAYRPRTNPLTACSVTLKVGPGCESAQDTKLKLRSTRFDLYCLPR